MLCAVVSAKDGVDKFDLNERCVSALSAKFGSAFYIGEDISMSEMYSELSKVVGVYEAVSVKLNNKTGASYSGNSLDINANTSTDGTTLTVPKNAVVEIKYPDSDIKGQVR